MHRRTLGQLEVSAIGLGCGTMTPFYGEPDRAAGIATIRRAREIGVDLLDTADGYGRGRNEELVAEAVRGRGDYVIASKSAISGCSAIRASPTAGRNMYGKPARRAWAAQDGRHRPLLHP